MRKIGEEIQKIFIQKKNIRVSEEISAIYQTVLRFVVQKCVKKFFFSTIIISYAILD